MRSIFREFWILLILSYIVLGFSITRAEDRPLDRAVRLVNAGRVEEAIPILRTRIAQSPYPEDVQLALSIVYLEKGENNRALAALEKARALAPRSALQ